MSYLGSLFSLQEKVAIVTGAKRGNGRALQPMRILGCSDGLLIVAYNIIIDGS